MIEHGTGELVARVWLVLRSNVKTSAPSPQSQCDSFDHELLPHPRRTFLSYSRSYQIACLRVIHEDI